jgi:anti-sigma factor RsiW
MTVCEANSQRTALYVEGELREPGLTEFESHLSACAACQAAVAGRRRFLADLAEARPLCVAPPALRLRVEGLLAGALAQPTAQDHHTASFGEVMHGLMAALLGLRWATPQAACATILLLAVAGGLWWERQARQLPRSAFAAAALEAHRHRLQGGMPLDLRSSSPATISAWFQGKVPLHVSLPPNEDLPPQQQAYQIEGAGTVAFGGGHLGYIAYRVGTKPVSLLIAPAAAVTLRGRKQVAMKSLTIHYDDAGGFHIVTWAIPRKGVTYALVSESGQHPNQSCIVCHASPKDRAFMHALLSQ